MPHSVSPEPSPSTAEALEEDSTLPDAPTHDPDEQDAALKVNDPESTATAPVKAEVNLEDLFNDDEEDEEFPSSSPPSAKVGGSPPAAPLQLAPAAKYSDPEVMLAFYQRLFPFRYLFQWLNHSIKPSNDFAHREFAFTLQNDAYLRYQSFTTADLLRKDVLRLNPSRFEIGPVYTANPRDRKTLRKSTAFRPVAKELVFDIDLTDYDEIRTCCDKANICHKCWSFVRMAIKVVDAALRDDFGFDHIMWVYSGRRGAHAWISDKRAREMDDQKRKALAGYLEVIKGGAQSGKKVNVKRPLHPHLARSLNVLKDHFQTDVLEDQDPWSAPEKTERLLQLLPDKTLNDALRKKWDSAPGRSSASKWADIDALAKTGVSRNLDKTALLEAKQDIVLEYTYPRLDVEVSKKQIHLLKSPFVVHPGTGRVCVPIDLKRLDKFDPLGVPTVTELLGEIDAWDAESGRDGLDGDGKKIQDYEKTGLKAYVEYFKSYVAGVLRDERGVKREREEGDGMEF
ncbi:MAG: eukaryotic and archaeal DNA primase small subunit [Lasallia pustulata]|uniref:DNA primase n=1 Tax=Lasallia pustulata TaxID=136370 RepID=A0A5M8PQX6_9LECA|nr:MAG: eukaryotic and archaeal DNA primase small subunit [Lasallia pustulata]